MYEEGRFPFVAMIVYDLHESNMNAAKTFFRKNQGTKGDSRAPFFRAARAVDFS